MLEDLFDGLHLEFSFLGVLEYLESEASLPRDKLIVGNAAIGDAYITFKSSKRKAIKKLKITETSEEKHKDNK